MMRGSKSGETLRHFKTDHHSNGVHFHGTDGVEGLLGRMLAVDIKIPNPTIARESALTLVAGKVHLMAPDDAIASL